MDANDATLTQALDCVETTWATLRESVLNDRHLLWVGSGVSRDRFPDLPALIEKLFTILHAEQNASDPNCPYFKVAKQIVRDYSHVTGLNLRDDPSSWSPVSRRALFEELSSNYAKVLGETISIPGSARNIPFDILRLEETYSDPAVLPDAGHRLLALLVAEGAVTQIVTTNWDTLTERAYSELGLTSEIWVIACTAELNGANGSAMILKVHGCAERTKSEPAKYKRHMVATHREITRWSVEPIYEPFVEKLRTLLRERPSLFVGISGQDFNLQSQCVAASCNGPHIEFPPPRISFSSTSIGVPQREILRAVHGENYPPNQSAIDLAAALPLYAKPLFGALYVSLILEKLRIIIVAGGAEFANDEQRDLARLGLGTLRQMFCTRFDGLAVTDRWRILAAEVPAFIARFLELYRNQRLPTTIDHYAPIHTRHPEGMMADPNLPALRFHWVCLVLAALSLVSGGGWRLNAPTNLDGSDGQLHIETSGYETSLFFLNQDTSAAMKLESIGAIAAGSGRRVLLIYPALQQPANRLRRNPGRILPGTRSPVEPRELWFCDCALEISNKDDLVKVLKQEIAASHAL